MPGLLVDILGGMVDKNTNKKVLFVARGAHLEAMLFSGLVIRSPEGNSRFRVQAGDDPRAMDKVDLVLFTVKSYDTDHAIEQIRPVVGPDTQILTLQNGIENYMKLVDAFGEDHVIQGFCRIGASVPKPGVIQHSAMGTITIGDTDSGDLSRLKAVQELFSRAGVSCQVSDDIRHEVWVKFTWNSIFNMLTALMDVTVDRLFSNEIGDKLLYDMFDEIRKVAATRWVKLTDEDAENIIEGARKLNEGFETSTYQDRQHGKRLEYEAFTGAIVRLAREADIPVPIHETLYKMLNMLDPQNQE